MTKLAKVRYNENMIVCSRVIAKLISEYESVKFSGRIENIFFNHLWYADDLCLISLLSVGMQKLLSVCS